MGYFFIFQDKRYRNPPFINQFYERFYPNLFNLEACHRIPDKNVVYAQSEKRLEYIDMISGPVCLVSEPVKRVLEAYDDTVIFKLFFILNTLADQGEPYYAPIVPETDCIKAEGRGRDAKLVIDGGKVSGFSICRDSKVAFRNGLVINLEVAESLLRRPFKGIKYQRLEGKEWQIML